jgi:hypothetical protein
MADAVRAIEGRCAGGGYIVSFEWREGRLLRGDHFPDVRGGEAPIGSEERAWELAVAFAKAMGDRVCNVFAGHASDFTPVAGYREKILSPRGWSEK